MGDKMHSANPSSLASSKKPSSGTARKRRHPDPGASRVKDLVRSAQAPCERRLSFEVLCFAKQAAAPSFSACFAERVGARFPIRNRISRPPTFYLTSPSYKITYQLIYYRKDKYRSLTTDRRRQLRSDVAVPEWYYGHRHVNRNLNVSKTLPVTTLRIIDL
jgi:hypothetical protein